MRPSSERDVVVVLDTLPECKVVLDALEDYSFTEPPTDIDTEDFANSTGVRFRQQTQYEPRPPRADIYVELEWKTKPEFNVEPGDIEFIRKAAQRALIQKGLVNRSFNFVTKRNQAAKNILKFLDSADL